MVQLIGKGKSFEPEQKVLVNKSSPVPGTDAILTVKTGIMSTPEGGWRAWYSPVLNSGGGIGAVTILTAPPGGLSMDKAKILALQAASLQELTVALCLKQLTENAEKELAAKAEIDNAIIGH